MMGQGDGQRLCFWVRARDCDPQACQPLRVRFAQWGWLALSLGLLVACFPRAPQATPTPNPSATPVPTPSVTPTPTRVPNCPASHPDAPWIAPPDFAGYPASISAYLNAGGSTGGLRSILENASSINAQFGGLWSFDLTGDSDPETIVSIFDPLGPVFGPVPGGFLLIYGCFDQTAPLLYQDS